MNGTRAGGALVVALLGLLLLEMVVASTIAVAASQRLLAAGRVRHLRARLAAESGVRAAIADWDPPAYLALGPGGVAPGPADTLPGAVHEAEVQRLGEGLFVVRGRGIVRGAAGPISLASAAAVVATLPESQLWRAFDAAVIAPSGIAVPDSAVLDGLLAAGLPPGHTAADCPTTAGTAMITALGASAVPGLHTMPAATVPAGARVTGLPPVLRDSAYADSARIAGFAVPDLGLLADRIENASLSLAPVSSGATCLTAAPGNWGDPLRPSSACGGYFPLIFAPGPLRITAGAGQGVLLVDGDLRIDAGVRFHGAILATGSVDAPAAEIVGSIRAGTGPAVLGGSFLFNACILWRAFSLSPGLGRPFRASSRSWIPAF